MRLCTRLLLTLSVALLPLTALAAPARASNKEADADAAARQAPRAGQTQLFVYDDEQLDGDSLRPDHERIDQRRTTGHASMINVRAHFIQQLLQMANDV